MLLKKIEDLTKDLPDRKAEAMEVFRRVIDRVKDTLEFKEVIYQDVYKIISKLKNSKSRGENELNNLFLKEIQQYVSFYT